MRFDTLAVRSAAEPDATSGAIASSIHLSTTFERAADGEYPGGYRYIREGNPSRTQLESALAVLEGGRHALAFSSGLAATAALLQTLCPGDHVIAPEEAYYGTLKLLREVYGPWGLESSTVDTTDVDAVRAAVRPRTRLIWVETPSNPRLRITDIAALAEVARGADALLACDNTWVTPVFQRPLEHGAHIVMHSTTKYIGGHTDVQGGALVTGDAGDDMVERLRLVQQTVGAVPSPFDSWLALRGLRTLAVRMRAHAESASRVARFLAQHPSIEVVHHPDVEGFPGAEVARRQMIGWGGMLSFQVRGSAEHALAVSNRLRLFTSATSFGGVESLVEHRASVEGPTTTAPQNLLRLSIGLEDADDLIEDLAAALG